MNCVLDRFAHKRARARLGNIRMSDDRLLGNAPPDSDELPTEKLKHRHLNTIRFSPLNSFDKTFQYEIANRLLDR